MFKLIKEYNELIDIWYHYRKLCKRLSSIRYYRRHGKLKPNRVSIFQVYKNAFKGWFELFNITFFVKETIDDRNKEWRRQTNELYKRYKEKQDIKKLVAKSEYKWYITAMNNCVTPLQKHNQYEYPVGKTITHVRWVEEMISNTYFTKGMVYKVNKVKEFKNGSISIWFETNENSNDHCRMVFKRYKRDHADEFELIYDNNI